MEVESAISIYDLVKTFDEKNYVLNGISLEIPKGCLIAIIGYSGTGKSVILKHILGLFKPTSGRIEVLGQDIGAMSPNQLTAFRRKFGVLFQGSALFDDMNVLENVCFPLVEHRPDMSVRQMVELAQRKLEEVGLDPKHFYKPPSEISAGMQKRTGLARALVLDPEILFYDEPTTGLDPILTEMVDNLIDETHKRLGGRTTTVMVSHDLDAAFRIADYVVMLDQGKVVLFGSPPLFMKSEIEIVRKFIEKGMRRKGNEEQKINEELKGTKNKE